MKIKNWIVCVQDRRKWTEFFERAKSFNQEVQRLEEEEEEEEEEYLPNRELCQTVNVIYLYITVY